MNRMFLPGILLASALLSGCTTSNAPGVALGTGQAASASFDLALPETMTTVPAFVNANAVGVIDAPDTARFAGGNAIGTVEVPEAVSFAGPTPSSGGLATSEAVARQGSMTGRGGEALDRLIVRYAAFYEIPEALVHRVVKRESNYFPGAYNNGHWGLMQIKHATARGMGYKGTPRGLLDAETNLKYAVKYLRGAWLVAEGNHDLAVRYYARGYYYDAKRKGLLEETGLGVNRKRRRG